MCRSIISLGKITHKMWQDHPFMQTNKATKELWGAEVGGEVEEGWTKFEKKGDRIYSGVNIWKSS